MRARLTEALLAGLKPSNRDEFVFDTVLGSFGYRLTPAGTGIFFAGKPRRTIGYRPALRVTEAREEARQMLADIRQGRDPIVERQARQQALAAGEMTVAALADKWLEDYVRPKLKPRTIRDYEQLLRQHILPALGSLPVTRLDLDAVTRLHVEMKRTPRRANYTIRALSGLVQFACDRGLRPPLDNPCRKVALYREQLRERFMTEDEIGRAADGIEQAERSGKIGPHGAAGLRLALFTGARSGEITAVEWGQIDWHRKIIRLPDSKTNEPRTIHLSEAALEVLRTIPRIGRFVIAGAREDEPYKNLGRAWIIARKYAGLEDVRLHDLRHSYASLAASRGLSMQMIGKLLGHKVPATTQRYAHLARDAVAAANDELGAAMTAAIAKGSLPRANANVVKLKRRRRRAHP
jgi:integrase